MGRRLIGEAMAAWIASEMEGLAPARRGARVREIARQLGVSVSTVNRAAPVRGRRATAPSRPEYRDWVETAVKRSRLGPDGKEVPGRPAPLEAAIEAAIAAGDLPPEAAAMPLGTAYRVRLELRLRRRGRRHPRMGADYPMQAVQMDASTSMYLAPAGPAGDGDWRLRLHARPRARGYKNKPLARDRMRALVYSLWDMCTGYVISRYCVARGENAFDAMDFLCWALGGGPGGGPGGDDRHPFHGVPDGLWLDQGPLFKHRAAADLLEELDIEPAYGLPYAKERMGGVERAHRTRWQRFERSLFMRGTDGLLLSELNDRLAEFEARENARRPSRTDVAGRPAPRTDAWIALTNARPADNRLRRLPAGALKTMADRRRCKVDARGIIRWDNREYEVPWDRCWALCWRPVDPEDDRLVAVREDTGERFAAVPPERRPHGEVRAAPPSPLERLLRDAEPPEGGADLYAPSAPDPARPRRMPARSDPAADLRDPLAAPGYGSVGAALAGFIEIYPWPLSAADRAAVRGLIEAGADLSREAVEALARRCAAAREDSA